MMTTAIRNGDDDDYDDDDGDDDDDEDGKDDDDEDLSEPQWRMSKNCYGRTVMIRPHS